MTSLINKQLLLTAYAYLFIMEQQKGQQGGEALQLEMKKNANKTILPGRSSPDNKPKQTKFSKTNNKRKQAQPQALASSASKASKAKNLGRKREVMDKNHDYIGEVHAVSQALSYASSETGARSPEEIWGDIFVLRQGSKDGLVAQPAGTEEYKINGQTFRVPDDRIELVNKLVVQLRTAELAKLSNSFDTQRIKLAKNAIADAVGREQGGQFCLQERTGLPDGGYWSCDGKNCEHRFKNGGVGYTTATRKKIGDIDHGKDYCAKCRDRAPESTRPVVYRENRSIGA